MSDLVKSSRRRILLVEDDLSLGEILQLRLGKDYDVEWVQSKAQAQQIAKSSKNIFDLVIMDVGLPDGSGFDLAKELKLPSKPALVFLTAQGDAESRLQGYELGAEEYIPKPFHLKELLLRVQHVLDQHVPEIEIQLEHCSISFADLSLRRKDGSIEYPPSTDMKVLRFLIEQSPRPVSRDDIMNAVWGVEKNPSIRTIDNTMVRLRQLLQDEGEKYIRSVRGVGYQWVQPSFAKPATSSEPSSEEN